MNTRKKNIVSPKIQYTANQSKTPKKKPQKKLLTYSDISEDDKSKQWNIEKILDVRYKLRTDYNKKEFLKSHPDVKENSKQAEFAVQYLIRWQPTKDKKWNDTWQPEQNLEQKQRLRYLISRKQEQKIQKKKRRENAFLMRSNMFAQNKKSDSSLKQRQILLNMKNNEEKLQKKKMQGHSPKRKSYPSYINCPQQFQILIDNFLNGNKKIDNIKKKDNSLTQVQSFLEEVQIPQQHFSKQVSQCFIEDMDYYKKEDEIDYFKIRLRYENKIAFISEQNLVKYFPSIYSKYIQRQERQTIEQFKQKILSKQIPTDRLLRGSGLASYMDKQSSSNRIIEQDQQYQQIVKRNKNQQDKKYLKLFESLLKSNNSVLLRLPTQEQVVSLKDQLTSMQCQSMFIHRNKTFDDELQLQFQQKSKDKRIKQSKLQNDRIKMQVSIKKQKSIKIEYDGSTKILKNSNKNQKKQIKQVLKISQKQQKKMDKNLDDLLGQISDSLHREDVYDSQED